VKVKQVDDHEGGPRLAVDLILETAAKYGVPVDMPWKPTGAALIPQPAGK